MRKQGLKITSKVLTGLVLLTGVTALPTNALDVNNAAVDVNVKEVKVSVYEKNGNYYARLTSEKEVANVVARIVVEESKAEFVIKRDIIKPGEAVEVELDLKSKTPTKKLPHTAVERKTINTTVEAGGYKFKISVRYEIATPEVKARQEENKKGTDADNSASGKEGQPKAEPKETEKPAETPKPATPAAPKENTVPKPETGNAQPSNKPAGAATFLNAPAAVAPKAPTIMNNATPAAPKVTNTEKKQEAPKQAPKQAAQPAATPKAAAPAPQATTREEQIRQAYISKVNALRAMNGLSVLKENAALNAGTKARSLTVLQTAFNAAIHGPAGSHEKAAAAKAGYPGAQHILYNVAINTNSGTPDQVAQRLLDTLYHEIGNVTTAFPYGHRNTLLAKSATEIGVGITISGGRVALVHHQNNSGAFQGITPIPSVYLDGKRY
ncbi:SCP extracellular protein [Gemella morbillorum M424]|uniref:CAP domain-containing protein n=1 Tax=Gemella morbillorum TaxID=29391 RepID=A0AAP9KSY0_9BACL|nr:CAP domain-containing protein [Gemella morbillorum]EFV35394.1 SCP extracellular protein [Gemella morbillorum M424]QGS08920.1 CAP domain-containing protein [Gemella morbillorum]